MKNAILIVVTFLLAVSNLSAMTIDTVAKYDTVSRQPTQVQSSFGKLSSSGKHGIFLNITCRSEEGSDNNKTLFYRLNCDVIEEDKCLYAMNDGKKIKLAQKKWYGWTTADGVKIRHSIKRSPQPTFKVWVEIE